MASAFCNIRRVCVLVYIGGRKPAKTEEGEGLSLMNRKIKRGDMFYADLGFVVGSEQSGFRPALILSNDTGNRHGKTVIAAIITSKTAGKPKLPTHCPLKRQPGLGRDSIVLLEQIRTIDKTRLKEYIGTLAGDDMSRADKALAVSLGLKYIADN
jgi:mRNA interferase MazF